jgi:hypothetical protein
MHYPVFTQRRKHNKISLHKQRQQYFNIYQDKMFENSFDFMAKVKFG